MMSEAEAGGERHAKEYTGRAFSGTRGMLSLDKCQKGPLEQAGCPKQRNILDREENRTVLKTMAVGTNEHGSHVG